MRILCGLGIPCDFTWCKVSDIAAYPAYKPLIHHCDGPYSVVRFKV